MSDTLTFAELEAQHVELLPARTVLSLMFSASGGRGGDNTSHGGSGGYAVAVNAGNFNVGSGHQTNIAAASADGGHSSIHHGHHPGHSYHAPTNTSTGGNGGIAIAVNAGNINFGSGDQTNVAVASANGGSSRIR